jgi:hypothetical protein
LIYIEYIDYRKKYYEAQKRYDNILSEKEKLFAITQPKATRTDTSRVSGGHSENTFDTYLIQKEEKQIDARLEEVRSILEDRKTLLKAKEEELKHSKDWLDIIYVYYHIENLSIRKIAKRIPFSTTEIFRKLKKIEKSIK